MRTRRLKIQVMTQKMMVLHKHYPIRVAEKFFDAALFYVRAFFDLSASQLELLSRVFHPCSHFLFGDGGTIAAAFFQPQGRHPQQQHSFRP